ncbi:MAG: sialate O-acetylesterase, partial [Planctomycetaceae bacterium]
MRIFVILAVIAAPVFGQQELPKETWLPSVFGSHMVLQRDQEVPVWGWDKPGQAVRVELSTDAVSDRKPVVVETKADETGAWRVQLPATPTGGTYKVSVVGSKTISMTDVLFGEVWICSGQSNMAWPVNAANDSDLERMAAKFPNIRLISVPQVGTQEPQPNFKGEWTRCSPETVGQFSAVGYFFGRQLHQTLDVPIGLIDNAWGGSACEAWINRDRLKKDGRFDALLESWQKKEANLDSAMKAWEKRMVTHREKAAEARKAGKRPPRAPRSPQGEMRGNQRPANIYNGVLKPTIGYGIRGAIWYQGESNASRAYQYRDLFP